MTRPTPSHLLPFILALLCTLCGCSEDSQDTSAGAFAHDTASEDATVSLNTDTEPETFPGGDIGDVNPLAPELTDAPDVPPDTSISRLDHPYFYSGLSEARGGPESSNWQLLSTLGPPLASGGISAAQTFTLLSFSPALLSPTPRCGDHIPQSGELCDASNLRNETCISLGYAGGDLSCQSDCQAFDESSCTADPTECGNGVIDPGEDCDGSDLKGLDCTAFDLLAGTLSCGSDCKFDLTNCLPPDPPDPLTCECTADTDLPGLLCSDFGFTDGDGFLLSCGSDCQVDLSVCGFLPLVGLTSSSRAVCGVSTADGTARCRGFNSNNIILMPSAQSDLVTQNQVAVGDHFTAIINNSGQLHLCVTGYLTAVDGSAQLASTDARPPATALTHSDRALCFSSSATPNQVNCYTTAYWFASGTVIASLLPTDVNTDAPFAVSDTQFCYIPNTGNQLNCLTLSTPTTLNPISIAASLDVTQTQALEVSNTTACLLHPDATAITSQGGNALCLNATTGSPVTTTGTDIHSAQFTKLVVGNGLSQGTWCGILAAPFGGAPAGGVVCWAELTAGVFSWHGALNDVDGQPFDTEELTLSDAYACVQDAARGARCVVLAGATPTTHEGQLLAPSDKFSDVALDPLSTTGTGCAVRASGPEAGEVVCWGGLSADPIPGATFTQVAVSNENVCGLSNGELVCNNLGAPTDTDFIQVAGGIPYGTSYPMCALNRAGGVKCWSAGSGAALLATQDPGPYDKISVGNGFYCGLTPSGDIACSPLIAGSTPPLLAELGPYVDFDLGANHGCAVHEDGRLICWGAGAAIQGEVGAAGELFTQVSVQGTSVCALQEDLVAGDLLRCWDGASAGALDGEHSALKSVELGAAGGCALRRNNELVCWGRYALGNQR